MGGGVKLTLLQQYRREEYSDTTTKFGPLTKSESHFLVSGLLDKFFTHSALVVLKAFVDGNIGW